MPRPSVLGELLQELVQAQTDPKFAAQARGLPTLEQSYPREGVTPVYPEEWLMPGKLAFQKLLSPLALGGLARVGPGFVKLAKEAKPRDLGISSRLGQFFRRAENFPTRVEGPPSPQLQRLLHEHPIRDYLPVAKDWTYGTLADESVKRPSTWLGQQSILPATGDEAEAFAAKLLFPYLGNLLRPK